MAGLTRPSIRFEMFAKMTGYAGLRRAEGLLPRRRVKPAYDGGASGNIHANPLATSSPICGPLSAATLPRSIAVTLTGDEPQLPSSFRVAAAAQASIAAAGLAAANIWQLRSGQSQDVAVDMRHAVVECRSERYLRVDGKPPGPAWDAIAGIYKTGDGRFVRLHTNFRHHRDAVCKVLELQAGARRGAGRADAMGRRGVRNRGLRRRLRGRADALA